MDKNTLHFLRLITPGIIFFIYIIPLLNVINGAKDFFDYKISKESLGYLITVIVFGFLYYISGFRYRIMRKGLHKINENIKDTLLAPFKQDLQIKKSIKKLKEGNKLLNTFYSFVDNNNSLKERAKEVYINGFVWSSLVDIILVSWFAIIIYICAFFLTNNNQAGIMIFFASIMSIVSYLLTSTVIEHHIKLSNNQLLFIIENCKKELREKIEQLI